MITEITDEELESINYAISSRYGLDFGEYEKTSLKRRILRIIHRYKLENVIGLWQKLLYDKDFVHVFRDEVSVGLTEMFRNPEVWVKLKDVVLPSWRYKNEIYIWHAGCSTGEEVSTMAITLHQAGLLGKAKALATDLSSRFVHISTQAEYQEDDFKKYAENYMVYNPIGSLNDYFLHENNQYVLRDAYKKYAKFMQHNIVADKAPFGMYDIIFCRNVMIYFNDTLKLKALEMFHKHLSADGLLVIGYFDAMPEGYNSLFEYYDSSVKFFKPVTHYGVHLP